MHTHLAMFFDRSIEALQLAAQKKGYAYDRAILPWDQAAHPEPNDFKLRAQESQERKEREDSPGLLIFRAGRDWQREPDTPSEMGSALPKRIVAPSGIGESPQQAIPEEEDTPGGPLFVFVVGETPTGGIHREQFRRALVWIREIRGDEKTKDERPLLILGPTFSGSLESLGRELDHPASSNHAKSVFVYSGTVTSAPAQCRFARTRDSVHLASFQENDAYTLHEFLGFAKELKYETNEIAVLSEDETVYGGGVAETREDWGANAESRGGKPLARLANEKVSPQQPAGCPATMNTQDHAETGVVQLHFPREISYLRSAYQKKTQMQQQPVPKVQDQSRLPLDLNESGNDDDTVPSYAPLQTPLSQEAEMMGIVSELHKHHVKFTVLMATDPLDQLFLVRYLRQAYPQGRVVITVPDLLLNRQDDALLHGVMALNNYSLIPGLRDILLRPAGQSLDGHDDRVFVSSNSVGTFNAMVGLLSVGAKNGPEDLLPSGPYADYGPPIVSDDMQYNTASAKIKPILWLTMLGRDGFWPIVGIRGTDATVIDWQEPILSIHETSLTPSTLKEAIRGPSQNKRTMQHVPPAWTIAYFLIVVLLAGHAILSAFGSILADSEVRAQFARNSGDIRGAIILALGAWALSTSFVLIMCARTPLVTWSGFSGLTLLLWLPYPVFVGWTILDLGTWREQPRVAAFFAVLSCATLVLHIFLVWSQNPSLRMYWSTRVLHLASGLSPILPMLVLLGAGYWWMWTSLKGIALVDLRRPRLPDKQDLPFDYYRISDSEGEQLRNVSHPFFFTWQVMICTIVLAIGVLAVMDLKHPVQTVEGLAYDWGYSLLLALMVATFLGCLLKLVITWFKCRQVLVGLDRTPLRHAFSRMKRLSWSSLWTPGGSSLRETYKIMSRALENQVRLRHVLKTDFSTPLPGQARLSARIQVCKTRKARQRVYRTYLNIIRPVSMVAKEEKDTTIAARLRRFFTRWQYAWRQHQKQAKELQDLMVEVEALQKEMASMVAVLIRQVLRACWREDMDLVVSEDDRIPKEEPSAIRALAEEFAAIMYVNFLASVLLRIRNLVICAGGLYALIVMSVSVYPFQPRSALQTLMVILLVLMALVVGYVYAEMHRESILSRLTSTTVGELGWDFWLKFASAAAIPVVSLLAGQFPEINRILFSWLEPALQAMK
jgi:hypothetical protein